MSTAHAQAGQPSEIFLENREIRVEKVHVTGLKRTKADYILDDVKPVFKCDSFLEAYQTALHCRKQLLSKSLFQNVEVFLDTTEAYENQSNNGIQVVFKVKERSLLCGEMKTEMSNHEKPRWVMRLLSPNLFGRGESLVSSMSHSLASGSAFSGIYQPTDFTTIFTKPYNTGAKFQLSLLKEKQDNPWSSYNQVTRGLQVGYEFPMFGNMHNLEWLGHWRELSSGLDSSIEVRKQMGHSLKSSLRHTLVVDKTDCTVLPTSGFYFKLSEEAAGLGGDIKFAKESLESSIHTTLFRKITLGLCAQGGVVLPFPHSNGINISDKFFMGGPLTLRGFEMNSAGSQDSGSFLGSTAFWVAGAHIYTPLPFFWSKFGQGSWMDNIRMHAFVNAGNLFDFKLANGFSSNLQTAQNNIRLSYGAGIVYKFVNTVRFEINFCVPVRAQTGDRVCHGLQFGLGISSV